MKLSKHLVEKPWGRTDIPAEFGNMGGKRIGEIWYEGGGLKELPILVKWLFTSEKLSIQVHPDDARAQARGSLKGKEECWYIVDAEPDAVLGIGTTRPLTADELRDASLSGEIERLMDWKPVSAGDYFYIPAGTVHAIGAGITLVEVQQNADITYRLYDYGRPRELHLDDGVEVSDARPYADRRSGTVAASKQLIDGPHFQLWFANEQAAAESLPDASSRWIIPVNGTVSTGEMRISVGECALIEAGRGIEFADGAACLVAIAL